MAHRQSHRSPHSGSCESDCSLSSIGGHDDSTETATVTPVTRRQHHVRVRVLSCLSTLTSDPFLPPIFIPLAFCAPTTRTCIMSYLTVCRASDESKKRKRSRSGDSDDMSYPVHSSLPSRAFLNPPPAPSRKPSERLMRPANNLEDFLSSDLELSFASTMSLNSPPESPQQGLTILTDDLRSPMSMDISPKPVAPVSDRRTRPRAFTTARAFGREMTNQATPSRDAPASAKGSNSKKLQRSALPTEWMEQVSSRSIAVRNILL